MYLFIRVRRTFSIILIPKKTSSISQLQSRHHKGPAMTSQGDHGDSNTCDHPLWKTSKNEQNKRIEMKAIRGSTFHSHLSDGRPTQSRARRMYAYVRARPRVKQSWSSLVQNPHLLILKSIVFFPLLPKWLCSLLSPPPSPSKSISDKKKLMYKLSRFASGQTFNFNCGSSKNRLGCRVVLGLK